MPPKGGFEPVQFRRNLPTRGIPAYAILGGVTAMCTYGFYRVYLATRESRELEREKVWSRIHLVPLLWAERDREAYRRLQVDIAKEKEIMKDVKNWKVGETAYHSKRYQSPPPFPIV